MVTIRIKQTVCVKIILVVTTITVSFAKQITSASVNSIANHLLNTTSRPVIVMQPAKLSSVKFVKMRNFVQKHNNVMS